MHRYVTLSKVFYLMRTKICIHDSLIRVLSNYKVFSCIIVLSVKVCTVKYICYFCRDQIFVDFVGFLSMIIYGSFLYIIMMFKV